MPSFSIVIAAYNEATTLRQVFERCLAVLNQCSEDFEIIILDDASTDQTGEIAEQIRSEHPDTVRVLGHSKNRGIAVTFEDLYRAAVKEYIFDIPADGEYPPEALLDILPLLAEYDIVVCHRTFKEYTTYRHIVSYLYRLLPRLLFGVELYDPGSAKCRSKNVIEDITVTSTGVFSEAERLIRAIRRGYRIGKVDVVPGRRIAGDPQGAKISNVACAGFDLLCLWLRLIVLRQKA
jgi:glycosyltransferase involved in cell wall biosynthesis